MKRPSWNEVFGQIAKKIAERSRDMDTKVGAVIINPEWHTVVSLGYNGMPRGINDDKIERYARPEKYYFFEHAERNAIFNAANHGLPCKGCHIISTHFPCPDCTRAIIQVGITHIWHLEPSIPEHRMEAAERSIEMLREVSIPAKYLHLGGQNGCTQTASLSLETVS